MKTLRLFVVLAALLFAGVIAPSPARARATVSFDFFYDSLAPYGEWIEVGDYGLCWRPTGVDPDWTPYSDGYWAFTDAGWTWVSYEDFGGIVYHYGRWIRLDDESWCWMPDYEWAPAWVSWRSSDDYVGWAPLPPEARWRPEVGISVWVDRECDLGPGYYHFCRTRDFGAPVLRPVIINRWENVTIIRHTVNVTNITYNTNYVDGPVIYNGGPSFTTINRFSARPVPALKLVQEANFDPARHRGQNGRVAFNSQTVGNQLIVAAPQVMKPSDPAAFKARVKRVLPGDAVTKGWNMVKSPETQKELRQEMGRQSKGLTPATAPARAVAATDLKVVPVKADPTATPPTATAGDHRDRTDHTGRGPRPEGVVVQPNNIPPTHTPPAPTAPTATPFVKPAAPIVTATPPTATPAEPTGVVRGRGRNRNDRNSPPPNGPTAVNPNLKPFNPVPDAQPPQNPQPTTTFTPIPRGKNAEDGGAKARAAEQAKIRAEQQQQQAEQQRMDQQRQADIAAKQKQQADQAAQQQKQISAQQEAARAKGEEQRRREAFEEQRQQQKQQQMQIQQQQQQQLQQQQQQQQAQQQQQKAMDARRAQDAEKAARDRAREQAIEAQRAQQMRQAPPQPQPQPQQNNQGGGQPPKGGGHSKDGKDKDKDKDKDRN